MLTQVLLRSSYMRRIEHYWADDTIRKVQDIVCKLLLRLKTVSVITGTRHSCSSYA